MKATIDWNHDVEFTAHSGSGHQVIVDGPPDAGGANAGARPMELILMGLGTCTAFDVVTILNKARQPLTSLKVEVDADRVDAVPAVFTKIRIHFVLTGRGLSEKHVERAIALSAEKYCSASIMLGQVAEISHTHEIAEAD